MAIKRRSLGRGLDALLGAVYKARDVGNTSDILDYTDCDISSRGIAPPLAPVAVHLSLDAIERNPQQPRQIFSPDSLQELAHSISVQGVLQPILVRPIANSRYEIVAGERRWRACKMAGLTEIPAIIRTMDESVALAIGFIENSQRDSLTPLEEARAINRLIDEFGLTHQAIAQAIGKSRTTIANLLKLLDLEPETSQYLETNQIELGHARVLMGLKGQQQTQAAHSVVANVLSVKESDKLVRRLLLQNEVTKHNDLDHSPVSPLPDVDVSDRQTALAERLGTKVVIRPGNNGKGKLVITYNSIDELNSILARIA